MSTHLLAEVQARYCARGQSLGFVTGYMDADPAGQTGRHFANQHHQPRSGHRVQRHRAPAGGRDKAGRAPAGPRRHGPPTSPSSGG